MQSKEQKINIFPSYLEGFADTLQTRCRDPRAGVEGRRNKLMSVADGSLLQRCLENKLKAVFSPLHARQDVIILSPIQINKS